MTERRIPDDIEQQRFDLLVIGAGINGVAIARDAAMRGLRVLVLDKGDIGSGTTSWSTRLIHGGLRYLEHAELGLVRESLRERERLLRNAPHLVKPIPMILPIYADARRGPPTIRAGMVLYDVLSFDKSLDRHQMLRRDTTLRSMPALRPDGLRGAARFYDAQSTFAERLAVENALSAQEHGATIVTYARVDRLIAEGAVVRGVEFTDLLSGASVSVQASVVVNVAGPWVDQVLTGAPQGKEQPRLIGGTKGSHLVVPPFPGAPREAIYYEAKRDGRAIFVIPWNDLYLIGSTDIRYEGDLDDVRTDDREIDYLLAETNALLPGAALTPYDVLYTYCGVRPLPHVASGAEGAITRKHIIHNHAPRLRGLLSIVGGKLTTHRSLAEETVDAVDDQLGRRAECRTARLPLPGAAGIALDAFAATFAAHSNLPAATAKRLVALYGARASGVLSVAQEAPDLHEPFDPQSGAIGAEVVFAVRHELAQSLTDILMRRTMVGLGPQMGVGADQSAAIVARRHLGWDTERTEREVTTYRAFLERFRPRVLAGEKLAV
ncbi:MAG: glycerol-3-phosphate dehydrogenase [Thermomicrobiales bacterium]|nr:glycerol-3-phosphate dehydrogenase [Thermomicrobiales bacterium]